MDSVIRWSPHSTGISPRFLIIDRLANNLKTYEVESSCGQEFKYKQIFKVSKVPEIRAFDWSPVDEGLVALGLPSGETTVHRIDDGSSDYLSFSIRAQRSCNAVALSKQNRLAAGLDRIRHDFCLNIWDLNQRLSTWNRSSKGLATARPASEPIRKLINGETVSSIRFFQEQPETLVTGVKERGVRIYDLREASGTPAVQFQTWKVSNISIDTKDENYFASASGPTDLPTVCIWDRRYTVRMSASHIAPQAEPDPRQTGAVLVYSDCLDRTSSAAHPIIWSVRYSKTKRGCFGVLSNNGQLKIVQTAKDNASQDLDYSIPIFEQDDVVGELQHGLRTKWSNDLEHAYHHPYRGCEEKKRLLTFDFMSTGAPNDDHQIIAGSASGNIKVIKLRFPPPDFGVTPKRQLIIGGMESEEFLHRGSVAFGAVLGAQKYQQDFKAVTYDERAWPDVAKKLRAIQQRARESRDAYEKANSSEKPQSKRRIIRTYGHLEHMKIYDNGPSDCVVSTKEWLLYSSVDRLRCEKGYGLDSRSNIEYILFGNGWLRALWQWINDMSNATKHKAMTMGRLNISYLGIHAIWNSDIGPNYAARLTSQVDQPPTRSEFYDSLTTFNNSLKLEPYSGVATSYPEHRRLCLSLNSTGLNPSALEDSLREHEAHDMHSRSAAWALIFGDAPRAMAAISAGTPDQKLLSMAIAATSIGSSLPPQFQQVCRDARLTAPDVWSRALLAYVSEGSWLAFVNDTGLPMCDRLLCALRCLPDSQLSTIIETFTSRAVKQGDISAIALTGLGWQAVPLFQRYITATGDMQTAVLALSFAAPYLDDRRYTQWRTSYRHAMSRWGLHLKRCDFDVKAGHLARLSPNYEAILAAGILPTPPPRQISLRCNNCEYPLAQDFSSPSTTIRAIAPSASVAPTPGTSVESNATTTTTSASLASNASTLSISSPPNPPPPPMPNSSRVKTQPYACPKCAATLPRCVICSQPLGTPYTGNLGGVREASKKNEDRGFVTWCASCAHGFHGVCANEWFRRHTVCAVPECACQCGKLR